MSDDTDPIESAGVAGSGERLRAAPKRRYGAILSESRGQTVLHPSVNKWLAVATAARADGFGQLIDVTAVDFLTFAGTRDLPRGVRGQRYEVVANLLSHSRRERLRMRVQVPASEPNLPTLFDIWPGAEAMEREAFDMFGISFDGHPDQSRILMPEDWDGHPLRKDYATGDIPVQFKAASNVR